MKLDDILKFLRDGRWHSLSEIQEKTGLTTFKTMLLVNFLISYGLCDYTKGTAAIPPCPIKSVKLKEHMIQFLQALDQIDKEEDSKQ